MKSHKIRSALSNLAVKLFIAQVIVAGCALLANVLSARTLGPEVRGELGLFMQIAYVANVISVLGRHRSYLKVGSNQSVSLGRSFHDIRKLSRQPLIFSVFIAGLATLIVSLYGTSPTLFLGVGLFALIYSGVQQKILRSGAIVAGNANPYFVGSVAGQILMLIGVVFLTYFDNENLTAWIFIYGVSVVFPYSVIGAAIGLKNTDSSSEENTLQSVKKLGIRFVPLSVAETAGSRLDRFLIPALANFSQLGIYTVVVTMTELIAWPINNYVDSKVPKWTDLISNRKLSLKREIGMVSSSIILLSFIIGIGIKISLIPLFGSEYFLGIELIWPLVLAAGLHAFSRFGTNLCIAAGLNFSANAIPNSAMIISGISYVFLIPFYGALGAAWGLTLGYLVAVVLSLLSMVKIYRMQVN